MDYPGNFETPVFPAGKPIAVSRFMAIGTSVLFFVIICLCGLLLWSSKSDRMVPFMIATNNEYGEWQVIGRAESVLEYTAERTMQESVVGHFVQDWFRISLDPSENDNAWLACERTECTTGDSLMYGDRTCVIFCSSGDDVYSRFRSEVLPGHRAAADNGDVWSISDVDMDIKPAGRITAQGGTWRVNATVSSNVYGRFDVQIFMKVARNDNTYPGTMGFYVADFNAYRIN